MTENVGAVHNMSLIAEDGMVDNPQLPGTCSAFPSVSVVNAAAGLLIGLLRHSL